MSTIDIGRVGEELACEYLHKKGYEIVCKNWYCRWGEIDLVCFHSERQVVFVEVKYSRYPKLISAADLFTLRKKQKLHRTIEIFLNCGPNISEWHVDLVCVSGMGVEIKIKHYKDVLTA